MEPLISEYGIIIGNRRAKMWGFKEIVILAKLSAVKSLQLYKYKIMLSYYAHCKRMFLCCIMLWIPFLNISCRARRKSRWYKWITEHNPEGVEARALYGREDTSEVSKKHNLFGKTPVHALQNRFFSLKSAMIKILNGTQCI